MSQSEITKTSTSYPLFPLVPLILMTNLVFKILILKEILSNSNITVPKLLHSMKHEDKPDTT